MAEIELTIKLKKCPFCGGHAIIESVVTPIRCSNSVCHARNTTFVKTVYSHRGKRIYDVYNQTRYRIHCNSSKCLMRFTSQRFWSVDDAIEAWESRIVIEDK